MESDTPIKSKSEPDDEAELQSELDQVRALVAAGGSSAPTRSTGNAAKQTPKSKPGSKHQDADLTFGNDDDSPTPLRIPKRKRRDRDSSSDDDDSKHDSDGRGKAKHKRSSIKVCLVVI